MTEVLHTVDDVIKKFGVTARTLRYYEEIGLISPTARSSGGHRLYDSEVLQTLSYILRLRDNLGASLDEIRAILDMEKALERIRLNFHGDTSSDEKVSLLEESIGLLDATVRTIEDKVYKLQALGQGFKDRLERAKRMKQELEKREPSP